MTRSVAPSSYALDQDKTRAVAAVIAELTAVAACTDSNATVDSAHLLGGRLPAGLLRVLADFRRFGNAPGTLHIGGLPVLADLPRTPCVPDSVAVRCEPSAAALLLVMSRLGDPVSYAEEKRGALVQDICPVPGEEDQQQNTGAVYFKLHTENAFHTVRPDYVGLLCLREDHDGEAASITSSIREALPRLDPAVVAVLGQPRFRTRLAPSFCRGGAQRAYLPPAAVLMGTPAEPALSVDFDDTMPIDPGAERALADLHDALQQVRHETALHAGEMVLIDNAVAVHGRTGFRPRYDGSDRWLRRAFAIRSVRDVLDLMEPDSNYRCAALQL